MVSIRNLVLVIVGGLAALLCLASTQAGSRTTSTCVVCRLFRTETVFLGVRRQTDTASECSTWYREHVEPDHIHIWQRSSCTALLNGFGQRRGFACGRSGSIFQLPPVVQVEIYQHFKDPMMAKEIFANLADEKTSRERLDEDDAPRGDLIVSSLFEWANAGFPVTWEDWWDRWWKLHVAEHEQILAWHISKDGLSFSAWKEKRKGDRVAK